MARCRFAAGSDGLQVLKLPTRSGRLVWMLDKGLISSHFNNQAC